MGHFLVVISGVGNLERGREKKGNDILKKLDNC